MSFLENQLANALHVGLSPHLLTGTLRRLDGTSVDELGDPVDTFQDFTFQGFRDQFSAFAKGQQGIPETDYKISITARSINTTPRRDDEILLQGQWSRVRKISEVDPATALFVLQCYEISEPTT